MSIFDVTFVRTAAGADVDKDLLYHFQNYHGSKSVGRVPILQCVTDPELLVIVSQWDSVEARNNIAGPDQGYEYLHDRFFGTHFVEVRGIYHDHWLGRRHVGSIFEDKIPHMGVLHPFQLTIPPEYRPPLQWEVITSEIFSKAALDLLLLPSGVISIARLSIPSQAHGEHLSLSLRLLTVSRHLKVSVNL